ncbi:MAG TPA: dihydrodipicolinate synthase family protein [Candidatus Acidoferrum sp.]|jgi:4-hydroxy-2-oxoglutarate aldolase
MVDVSGIFPALTTPFRDDGSVALDQFKADLARYNSTGLAGYVVLGSTGESVLLSVAEAESLLAAGREAAAPAKLLIAGTGAESTAETIARTKRAAALGYHVALVKTPYYYKPAYKPEVYIRHYRSVADASPVPLLLYSVPIFTGITLETPEIVALAEHPNIIGIKDSSGAIQRIVEVAAQAPKNFQILTGSAGVLHPALASGAKGAILALASPLPEKCVELYELFKAGRHAEARLLQQQLALASKAIVSDGGIAGVKYAMDVRGYHGGVPRLPLLPLAESKKPLIAQLVKQFEPAVARA